MKKNKEELKSYFETGDKPTQEQYSDLIDSYIDAKQSEGEPNRRFVIDETGEVTIATKENVPEYTLSDVVNNKLSLLKDGVAVKEIDLTTYIDDTNLARLISGTVDTNGIATFKRDDDSEFTVDFGSLSGGSTAIPTLQEVLDAGRFANQSILLNEGGIQVVLNGGTSSFLGKLLKIKDNNASDGLEIQAYTTEIVFKTPINSTTIGGTNKFKLFFGDNRSSDEDSIIKVAEFYGRVAGKAPKQPNEFVTKEFADTTYLKNTSETNSVPASSTDKGTKGEIRFTEDYIYVCVDTNTWKRTALENW